VSLSKLRLPVVFVNRRGNKFGISVSVDDEHGVALGVDHLVELGHSEIAYIAGPRDIDTARRRRAGFITRMEYHGLKVTPSGISAATSFSESAGYEAMERLLARRRPPTAVIAGTFASAVGAVSAIGGAGLDVPGDISVVGFHDPPIARYLNPPLTTIRMPLAAMAETAVTTLVRMIEGVEVGDVVVTSPEPTLVEHASTRRRS
jgi:LacI family transcriptional regulator